MSDSDFLAKPSGVPVAEGDMTLAQKEKLQELSAAWELKWEDPVSTGSGRTFRVTAKVHEKSELLVYAVIDMATGQWYLSVWGLGQQGQIGDTGANVYAICARMQERMGEIATAISFLQLAMQPARLRTSSIMMSRHDAEELFGGEVKEVYDAKVGDTCWRCAHKVTADDVAEGRCPECRYGFNKIYAKKATGDEE